MRKTSHTDPKNICLMIFLFISGMLFCSCYTSPLYPNFLGWDSAIFSLMGRSILSGKTLYTDLFDHKGPIIFLINALGHLLGGRSGIFLLQCISGSVTVCLMYFTGKILRPNGTYHSFLECLSLFFPALLLFFYTFESGNLTEEYSLPFIALSCYFFIKYCIRSEQQPAHPPLYAFVYGICLAVLALLRLNNAVTVCAGILYIALYLCSQKQWRNLFHNLLLGLLGLAVVIGPTLLVCWRNGSLEEMIYATFLHNFVIAGNTAHVPFLTNWKLFMTLYLPFLVCLVLFFFRWIRQKKLCVLDGLLLCILIFNGLCLLIANRFPHYFTILVPVYLLFLFRYLPFSQKRDALLLCFVLLCTLPSIRFTCSRVASNLEEVYIDGNPRYTVVAADSGIIPEDENDSVIGFEVSACDYLALDIIPCYKYYTLQQTWSITTPHILPDFLKWVSDNQPIWLLTSTEALPEEMQALLDASYSFYAKNDYIVFYRLNIPGN